MKETNNKRKEEILASAVRSFPIYEVQQICFESRRYPRRRIRLQRVGLFQTKESAEDAMHAYIKHEKECCETWDEDYYADSLGYYIDEVLVHNKYSEFYENERSQRCYSYTADGELNDCAVLDEFGWYRGRKIEDIRFKVGDIVEVVDGNYADLGIVGALPLTTDKYSRLEEDPDECEHPSHFLDESDDCYLVYTIGEASSHFHPVCYTVFPPTHTVPKKIAALLKANLEEVEKSLGTL